jgi:signal transduction histidine kinase
MGSSLVARHIRDHKQAIADAWVLAVRDDLVELTRLSKGALIDHLPEVLDGLADWIEGDRTRAEAAFEHLATGHAVQRLGLGIDLAVLDIEYAWLRHVVAHRLLAVPSSDEVRRDLIRCNEALDRAVLLSVRSYTERRDAVRERFIGILAHDLRNPLSAVSAGTNLLLRSETIDSVDRTRVEMIARASERMNRMITDVLDFARAHLGEGIPVTPEECDLGELCRTAADELRAQHPDRPIEVRVRGDVRGRFDPQRVVQALGNLVGNAVQHGEGPVLIDVVEADHRRSVTTRISNRGRPIPAHLVPRLFQAFHAVRAGEGEPRAGLGLGLYIVGQIVAAHAGVIEVSSTPAETTVTIQWPRTPVEETPTLAR